MRQEIEVSAKTVEAAIVSGVQQLGVDRNLVTYEILEMPKKGFLGIGETLARVKVCYETGGENSALEFVKLLIEDMELDATASMRDMSGNAKLIEIAGEDAGVLIGHHGETLDSLQYLVNLVANKREEDEEGEKKGKYTRITLDIEDYRSKREETLRTLARRIAQRVIKYKKSVTLEPMNPYERRIIHSEIQNIAGVTTTSVGADNNRKVVIFLENKAEGAPKSEKSRRRRSRHKKTEKADPSAPIFETAKVKEEIEYADDIDLFDTAALLNPKYDEGDESTEDFGESEE